MRDNRLNRAAEWVLRLVSPRRAAAWQHLRHMESDREYREAWLVMLRARGYRAAKSTEGGTPWLGQGRSADAEILTDLPALRNRCREINRDDPIGGGLNETFVKNIVGTGLRAQARTGTPDINERLEAVFNGRRNQLAPAENLTHGELQQLLIRKVIEDGEVLLKETKRQRTEPVWYEVIEADRLGTPSDKVGKQPNGHEIRDGVEKDKDGVPVAYWIRNGHPGDVYNIPRPDAQHFERMPAEAITHLKLTKRPGQTRGVPMFHAILQDLRDLDLLLLASIKRVQISACLAVFLKSSAQIEQMLDVTAKEYHYRLDQDIEPGMIFKLQPDEDISTLIPNFPTPELAPFVIMIARRIGAALGVSWQVVLKDFSDSTYSSARTDLLEARQTYVILRGWFVDKCLMQQWQAVIEDARLRGDPRLAGLDDVDLTAVQWFGDGWRWIDPVKEAQSIKIALATGMTTLEDEWLALGRDPDQMWQKLKEQKAKLDEAGITFGKPAPQESADGNGKIPTEKALNPRVDLDLVRT